MIVVPLKSVWEPIQKRNVMGGRLSRIFISHWNRERSHLLVGYYLGEDGVKRSRMSIHPKMLCRDFRHVATPADVGSVYPKGTEA